MDSVAEVDELGDWHDSQDSEVHDELLPGAGEADDDPDDYVDNDNDPDHNSAADDVDLNDGDGDDDMTSPLGAGGHGSVPGVASLPFDGLTSSVVHGIRVLTRQLSRSRNVHRAHFRTAPSVLQSPDVPLIIPSSPLSAPPTTLSASSTFIASPIRHATMSPSPSTASIMSSASTSSIASTTPPLHSSSSISPPTLKTNSNPLASPPATFTTPLRHRRPLRVQSAINTNHASSASWQHVNRTEQNHIAASLDPPTSPSMHSVLRHSFASFRERHGPTVAAGMDRAQRLGLPVDLIQDELFDWEGPLPDVPFNEPPNHLFEVAPSLWEFEKFLVFGMTLCLDSLLYCFSFLPIKFAISLCTLLLSIIRPSRYHLTAKHTFCLIQGLILLCSIALLSFAHLDLDDVYTRVGRAITWTRLHTLFFLFSALDTLLEYLNQRVTGYLSWSVASARSRIVMTFLAFITTFVHVCVLNMHVSTIHQALDGNESYLSLLLTVKFTVSDLKAGMTLRLNEPDSAKRLNASDPSASPAAASTVSSAATVASTRRGQSEITNMLLKTSANDIVGRFKWLVFLLLILCFKLSVSIAYYLDHAVTSLPPSPPAPLAPDTAGPLPETVFDYPLYLYSRYRPLEQFWIMFNSFSQLIHFLISDRPFYFFCASTPVSGSVGGTSGATSTCQPSAIPFFTSSSPPLQVVLQMLLVCYLAVLAIDWVKHAFVVLLNGHVLDHTVYRTLRMRFTKEFVSAPKIGLFAFVALPFTVMILREVWNAMDRMRMDSWLYRASFFLACCIAKIVLRLCLRSYAKRCFPSMASRPASAHTTPNLVPIPEPTASATINGISHAQHSPPSVPLSASANPFPTPLDTSLAHRSLDASPPSFSPTSASATRPILDLEPAQLRRTNSISVPSIIWQGLVGALSRSKSTTPPSAQTLASPPPSSSPSNVLHLRAVSDGSNLKGPIKSKSHRNRKVK